MWVGDDTREAVAWLEREFEKRWASFNFCYPLDEEKTVFYYGCVPPSGNSGLMFSLKDDDGFNVIVTGHGKERRL